MKTSTVEMCMISNKIHERSGGDLTNLMGPLYLIQTKMWYIILMTMTKISYWGLVSNLWSLIGDNPSGWFGLETFYGYSGPKSKNYPQKFRL